ncbi:MAG: hypothetical protein V2A58_12500 [Planctomycetota bacterium]
MDDGAGRVRERQQRLPTPFLALDGELLKQVAQHLASRSTPASTEELARLASRYVMETSHGARPYFPAESYDVGDRIAFVLTTGQWAMAEVTAVDRDQDIPIGRTSVDGDFIHVRFVDRSWRDVFPDSYSPPWRFVANAPKYQQEKARLVLAPSGPEIQHMERQLDRQPEIVRVGSGWTVRSKIPTLSSDQKRAVYEVIAWDHRQKGKGLETGVILPHVLERADAIYDRTYWEPAVLAEVENDCRFLQEESGRWCLAPPSPEVSLRLTESMLEGGCLRITAGVQHVLDYYRKSEEVTFIVSGKDKLTATVDKGKNCIAGKEILDWYVENKLSAGDTIVLEAPDPEGTALRLRLPVRDGTTVQEPLPLGRQTGCSSQASDVAKAPLVGQSFSCTARRAEIGKGLLRLPKRLVSCFPRAHRVTVHLAGNKESSVLLLDPFRGHLKGLAEWFQHNAVEHGDKIRFQLMSIEPPEIRIWTEWEKHIGYLFRCPAEDFRWDTFPIRDCLVRVLTPGQGPMHYRSLYSQISRHRQVAIGSVIATLSKYRGVLFEHSGRGMWALLSSVGRSDDGPPPSTQTRQDLPPSKVSEAVWRLVAEIEEGDVVYGLLKRVHDSLSFTQICQKIAETRGIDWHELQHTGFLNAEDDRLRRLDNGHFGLSEWFHDRVPLHMQGESRADGPVKQEPIAPTGGSSVPSRRSPTSREGVLPRILIVVHRMVRFLAHWLRRGPHV